MNIAKLVSADARTANTTSVTTSGIDTTGANLIVIGVSYYGPNGAGTVSDSKGNTWTALTARAGYGDSYARLYYCISPTVGTGHTFTVSGATNYPAIAVSAFSAVHAVNGYEAEDGEVAGSAVDNLNCGSLTPGQNDSLVVAFACDVSTSGTISIDGGFTVAESILSDPGVSNGAAIGYLIQTTAAAASPTWTNTGGEIRAAAMAVFRPALPIVAGTAEVGRTTYDSISVTWTAPTEGTGTATHQLQIDDGGGWEDVTGATSSPGKASGLDPNTEYDLRVKYTDSTGTDYSDPVTDSTDALTLVATQITLVYQAETAVSLCAHPVGGLFDDSATYQWYRSTTQGFTPGGGNILSGKTSRSLTDTGLTSDTVYYYVLRATKGAATVDYAEFDVKTLGATVGLPLFDAASSFHALNNDLAGEIDNADNWTLTISGENRKVIVAFGNVVNPAISAVAYFGDVPMMPVGKKFASYGYTLHVWELVNPPIGTHYIRIKYGTVAAAWYEPVGLAISFDESSVIVQRGLEVLASGTGTTASATVDTAEGELVFGVVMSNAMPSEGSGLTNRVFKEGIGDEVNNMRIATAEQSSLSWTIGGGGADWAIIGFSIKPVGATGTRPIPAVALFDERMIVGAAGQKTAAIAARVNWDINEDYLEDEVGAICDENAPRSLYYAGIKFLYDAGDYLGTTEYDAAAADAMYVFDRAFLFRTSYYLGGDTWRIFTDDPRRDYANTADANDLVIVENLRDDTPFALDANDISWPGYVRETAYHLMSHQAGDALGIDPRTTRHANLVTWVKAHVTHFVIDTAWVGETYQFAPFQMALSAEALIRHHTATGDSTVPPLIESLCNYLWHDAWRWDQQGMIYQLNPDETGTGRGTEGDPTLNNLIAKMYAWLAVQTGDQSQADRADWLFANSAMNSEYTYGKQLHQAHWLALGDTGTLAMREEFYAMADSKLTALSEVSVPALEDLLYLVDDPSGTPASTKVSANRVGGLLALGTCNGRLTLESGVPVSASDQSAKTSVYFTPYNGNLIGLYDGTRWKLHSFTERTLALGTITADKNYDIFIYDNAGTLTLELSAAWTNDSTRADALTTQDGVYVKSGSTTRRYLGTIRTTSTTTTEDSKTKRFVWNLHNQTSRQLLKTDATSHAYNSTTFRHWNNDTSQQVAFVVGMTQCIPHEFFMQASGNYWVGAFKIDSSTGIADTDAWIYTNSTDDLACGSSRMAEVAAGYHYIAVIQSTGASITFSKFKASAHIPC